MKTLIVRTDKLGDFYVTLPYIKSLVRQFGRDNIDIVLSENIFKHFQEKKYLFNNIYPYPKNNIFKKIRLIIKLRRSLYKNIIVFDGKDRSIILAILLKAYRKFIFIEKRKLVLLFKLIFYNKKYVIVINNKIDSYINLFTNLVKNLNINVENKDFNYLMYEELNSLNFSYNLSDDFKKYSLIHVDEKWFSNFYIKDYTDINPNVNEFNHFLNDFFNVVKSNLVITTGLIDLPFIQEIKKNYFKKVSKDIYKYSYNNFTAILIAQSSIKDIEILAMHSKNIITCNGPISQLACSFNVNLIDILEKKLESWYDRHIYNKNTYNKLYRKKFNILSNEILQNLK